MDTPYEYHNIQKSHISLADTDSEEGDSTSLNPKFYYSSEKVMTQAQSSLNDKICKQHRQKYAFVATPTKHLRSNLKSTSIANDPDIRENNLNND